MTVCLSLRNYQILLFPHLSNNFIFQCNKLEENGHESILITVGKENHWMTGSEQGLSFLHQKLLLVTEFINFCAGNYLHTVKPVLSGLSK